MSRFIQCDVCETSTELSMYPLVAHVVLPAGWVNGEEDDEIAVDVCSPECLQLMATRLVGEPDPLVTGETADQRHDGERTGSFAPIQEQPTFVSPVKVKSKGERSDV